MMHILAAGAPQVFPNLADRDDHYALAHAGWGRRRSRRRASGFSPSNKAPLESRVSANPPTSFSPSSHTAT
jgi:hypothetical protein